MTLLNTRFNRRSLATTFGFTGLLAMNGAIPTGAQRSPFGPATPAPDTTSSTRSLADVLTLVPLSVLEDITGGMPWIWNDLAAQFAALAMHHDLAGPDASEPFVDATL